MSQEFGIGQEKGKVFMDALSKESDERGLCVSMSLIQEDEAAQIQKFWVKRSLDDRLVLTGEDGQRHLLDVSEDKHVRWVSALGRTFRFEEVLAKRGKSDPEPSLEAPMPGKVAQILVAVGDEVKKGDTLLTVEAMKMEHALKSPRDGVVSAIEVAVGELVNPGKPLAKVTASKEDAS